MQTKEIKQSELTGECWGIQIWGTSYCEDCRFKDTEECGGKEIHSTGTNEKGFKIPLNK